jgi:Ca-activated chloride channel family protein
LKYRATKPGARWGLMAACAAGVLWLAPLLGTPVWAQATGPVNPTTSEKLGKKLKTETEMTLVNVTVTDPYGRLVTGLEQDAFRVFEDNTEQEIVRFSSEDVPISIGVIFDMSGSMTDKIDKSRLAAVQFFRTANPQDEFFLVIYGKR